MSSLPLHEHEHDEEPQAPSMPIEGFFSDLAEADMSPPVWVIKNVLPTGIVFLAGPPKTMKSTLEMAFSVVVSGLSCDVLPADMLELGEAGSGTVMGLSAEASAGELRHMVEVGMSVKVPDDRRIIIADRPWDFRLDDPEALNTLMQWLNTRKPKLFWLDPLRDFHSLEERDSGSMNRLLRPIQRWAKENDSCFLVVHHARKKANDDRTDYDAGDMRGTTALFGIADGVIMVTPRKDGKLYLKGTYKRGAEWEKEVSLKMWGAVIQAPLNETLLALSPEEKKMLVQMHRNKPISHLIGRSPKLTHSQAQTAARRLQLMGLALVRDGFLHLTDIGVPLAERVVRESSPTKALS